MTIQCKGKLIDFNTPKVMGILNLTPDSFYDGGKYKEESVILRQVEQMLKEGATFIDLGAYSSRPGASHITTEEERSRIVPVVELLCTAIPEVILSIDTFRSTIATACIEAGAAMINDISAGTIDTQMMATVGALRVPYIMMHMKGTPQTMESFQHYDDILHEMQYYFSEKIAQARSHGITDLILDPGFGFAKNPQQSFEVLQKLPLLGLQELPLLVGVSRKSMIYKTLQTTPDAALNGTSVLHTIAMLQGAQILRVHDVKEAVECVSLIKAYKEG